MLSQLRRLWPLGIRLQLMLWFLFVLSLLMFLFGAVFYLNLRSSLEANFDADLRLRAQQIAEGINDEQGKITVNDVNGELPGLIDSDESGPPGTSTQNNGQANVNVGVIVRLLNKQGHTVYVSPAFNALNAPGASVSQPLQGQIWQGTVLAHNGQPVRLYSVALREHGLIFGAVQVGESLASLDDTLQRVEIELLLIAPFVLLLGALGSLWLATRAFIPIERLIHTARQIEAGNLHERVPVPQSKDEIQDLALTLNEMIERLDQAFARQRRFVADASHELRTPVAAISSMTDVALAHDTPDKGDEYAVVLRDVNSVAARLGSLIADLLALARADEGKAPLEWEDVQLDTLAMDVAATAEPLAFEHHLQLTVEANEPVTVRGDEARLIQVIMNLVDNALAYTTPGGTVTVIVEQQGANACLIVRDTGIGIEPEHLPHIFERFYRTDPARSRAAGGAGLGLAIVDWVVRAHHGTIAVASRVSEGTTFTVLLPLSRRPAT